MKGRRNDDGEEASSVDSFFKKCNVKGKAKRKEFL